MLQNLSSAAAVIGALRVNDFFFKNLLLLEMFKENQA